jgi:dTDP-4-amino-4,6-dideoxygalactose transaminase
MLRYIAPAGTPIKVSELTGWLVDSISGKDRRAALCDAIKSRYGVKHCFLMSSGRAAMAMLFTILKKNSPQEQRDEIVLPAYTCYSVPAAAEIAGLKVRICDVDPHTLSYDMEQFNSIDFSRVLCVVSGNLYGYPNDLKTIESITEKAGCYLLDDAAQSMNAMIDQRYAGTWGDIGLYSLDKGKNITSLQGGIIVTDNDQIASWIGQQLDTLPLPSVKQQLADGLKLIAYMLMLKPYFYWIPANIPALGLGKTVYTTDYLFFRYSRSMAALAWRLFNRIDEISRQRTERARRMVDQLQDINGIKFIQKVNDSALPVYLRLPILVNSSKNRDAIIAELTKAGIGASCSYPQSIADLDNIRNFTVIHNNVASSGQYIARHILTLPSLAYMTSKDITRINRIFSRYQ